MSRVVWSCAGLAVFGAAMGPVYAGEPQQDVELVAPWDGATRLGSDTEIGVKVAARSDLNLVFDATVGRVRVKASFSVPAETTRTLWIPYRAERDAPVTLGLSANGEKLLRPHVVRISAGPIMAIVATASPLRDRRLPNKPGVTVMAVAPDSLPRTLQGYDQVDVLVIGISELARLGPRQLNAFQANLRRCGRVVVVGAVRKTAALFGDVAGCGGAFYRSVALRGDAVHVAGTLLDRRPVSLPGIARLREITEIEGETTIFTPVMLYLLFYTLAIVVTCVVSRRATPVLIVSFATSALALLVWYGRTPDIGLTVWSESLSGAPTARYSAVLAVEGRGVGEFDIPVPIDAVPTTLPVGATLRVSMNPAGQEKYSIRVATRLFTNISIPLPAASYASAAPVIEWSGARPVVKNGGDLPSPPLVLGWKGRQFQAPSLSPGMVWSPSERSEVERQGSIDQLFESRMKGGRAALLIPYAPPSLRMNGVMTSIKGWRMVISNPEQGAEQP